MMKFLNISTDSTLAGNSDETVVSEKAIKAYADTKLKSGDNVSELVNDAGYLVMGDLTGFVTRTTAQTISGLKTFTADIALSGTTSIKNTTSGVSYTMLYRDTSGIHVGTNTQSLLLAGSGTRPTFNSNNMALLSDVPTAVSQLTNDSGFITNAVNDLQNYTLTSALATVATTGQYSDLSGKPTIPTVNDATITITQGGVTKGSFTLNQASGDTIALDAGGGSSYTAGNGIDITNDVISVTAPTLVNNATGANSLSIIGHATNRIQTTLVGLGSYASGAQATAVGENTQVGKYGSAFGEVAFATGESSVALGAMTRATAVHTIQIGNTGSTTTNSDANTFKVANANGNFEIMSADGTIPEARLADTTNAQQGDVLTLDSTGNAVWQAGGGGGSTTLASLTDVSLTTPASGDALVYDGNDWINKDIDYVVEKQDPDSGNNYTWYRKYKSGWVEQGGIAFAPVNRLVSLPIEMANTYYTAIVTPISNLGFWPLAWANRSSSTTTAVYIDGYGDSHQTNRNIDVAWRVCGMAAN